MKRPTKGYSGEEVDLFPTMLNVSEPSTSLSRITSLPLHSSEPSTEPTPEHTTAAKLIPSPIQPTQPSPDAEQHIPTPHDSPLYTVHSHGSDEGSLKLNELTNLVTKLSARIRVLEDDLKKTKQTYSSAFTKLILRGRKISNIDKDPNTYLAQDDGVEWFQDDAEVQDKASNETKPVIQEVTPTEVIHDQGSSEKGQSEVILLVKLEVLLEELFIVGGGEETRRSSKETRKDKGKAIMTEPEPKKKSKKELEQERMSIAKAIRLQEQIDEEQRAQIARDEEIARQWEEQEKQRAISKAKSSKKIDWNDPSVIRIGQKKSAKKIEKEDVDVAKEKEEVKTEQVMKDVSKKSTKDVDSLSTKYPIVDWKTYILSETFMYYKIFRGDGSSKNYKILSEMLEDFDRQDVMDLYRLVKDMYNTSRPEGYDLML
ncbi:hypothetical protein Tco_1123165 [Tanacetum coccineum]|uniref:Uncharacterized protein n=1 Tax=Tanacetum coccineum TaxID=301880 RepID=A0ABQ5J2L7_9ASTR